MLVRASSTERDAFLVRVRAVCCVFFALVALVSLVADYARVAAVAGRGHVAGQ